MLDAVGVSSMSSIRYWVHPVILPAPQLAPDGHRIGGLALGKQRPDRLKHHAALGGQEVLRADPLQGLPHQPVVNEQ